MVRAAQCTHADECYGRAGMQRGMCCVLEAHMVQTVYMITVAGRLHQRREQMDGADAKACWDGCVGKFSMFGEGYILCFYGVVLRAAPAVDCR